MGRPKSSPEHAQAREIERREYKRKWIAKDRARKAAEREAAGQPKRKRGRPKNPIPDEVGAYLYLLQKFGTSVNGVPAEKYKTEGKPGLTVKELAAALKQEVGAPVKANAVAQRMHRVKKTGFKKST
jgi:hypothetical protein